jgi:F-type H+-transporting ATPase subunit b
MEINLFQLIFQIVNFLILLFFLKRFLYGPILEILEQRSKKIEQGLEAAEKSIEEQEKIEKKRKQMMIEAEKNASQILDGARVRAKKIQKELEDKAENDINRRLKRAEQHVDSQMNQMQQELSKHYAQSVIATSEKLLKDELGIKYQKEIINSQLKKLKTIKFL